MRTDYILKHDKLHLFVHKEYLSTGITYSDKQQEYVIHNKCYNQLSNNHFTLDTNINSNLSTTYNKCYLQLSNLFYNEYVKTFKSKWKRYKLKVKPTKILCTNYKLWNFGALASLPVLTFHSMEQQAKARVAKLRTEHG